MRKHKTFYGNSIRKKYDGYDKLSRESDQVQLEVANLLAQAKHELLGVPG